MEHAVTTGTKRRQGSAREHRTSRHEPRQRRPYAKPRLVEYGSVGKLTQGNSSVFTETTGHKRLCL